MSTTRKPVQKRSIERKQKISEAAFELFCEKGYYKTNTIEIAKRAGVSTGTVYSYFKDKCDIYMIVFEQYLNSFSTPLFEKLESLPKPFSLSSFIDNWIAFYIDLYASSSRALVQLKMMMFDDEKINQHFSNLENKYFISIIKLLNENGIEDENLFEKVYASCALIDVLRQEKSVSQHVGLNFDVLKNQVAKAVFNILSV